MKSIATPLIACILGVAAPMVAGPNHSHDHQIPGPNGGRVLAKVEPHAEFLVTPDRRVQITLVDDTGKAIEPAGEIITVTTGDRLAPTKLTFVADGGKFVSEQTLPEGNDLPTVVQIKTSADAKPSVERFQLNLALCTGCSKPEYACTCPHSH